MVAGSALRRNGFSFLSVAVIILEKWPQFLVWGKAVSLLLIRWDSFVFSDGFHCCLHTLLTVNWCSSVK